MLVIWAHYLGLSLINSLSHLTQCILYNIFNPFLGVGVYLSLLAPLVRFSGFILQAGTTACFIQTEGSRKLFHVRHI